VSRPDIVATVRSQVTLLRGRSAQRAAQATDNEGHPLVRYSQSGRGWTVPTAQMDDVEAYCQAYRLFIVVKDTRSAP
jgi:hypothetical protein